MAKLRLTKTELKHQKDQLKLFKRYLPTLILRKKQLSMELNQLKESKEKVEQEKNNQRERLNFWVNLFLEEQDLDQYLSIGKVHLANNSVAGIVIPVLEEVEFQRKDYDLFWTPLWVDQGLEFLKQDIRLAIELQVMDRQIQIIQKQLLIATQRVNLFEKIKIPEVQKNIRKIKIILDDQQIASVVQGKIAKQKLVLKGQNI